MFSLLENFVGFIFNSWRGHQENKRRAQREAQAKPRPIPPAPVTPDDLVLGYAVPMDAPSGVGASSVGAAGHPVTLSAIERSVHLHVFGRSGGGKTNLLLSALDYDIAHRHTCCVVDCRGDLVERVFHRLAENETPESLRERLVIVDLRETRHIVGFNPLGEENGDDPYGRAFHVLGVLHEQAESWGVQLEETLRNCLISLAMTGWTLLEIEPLLSDRTFRESVLAQVSDRSVLAFFERYNALSEDKQANWRLPVLNKITPLIASFPQLRLMLGQRSGFSFQRLLDEKPGSIILISLAQDRLQGAAHLIGGLLLSAFETAIMARAEQPEDKRVPCYLYLDELQNIVTQRFEPMIAEGRRMGLSCCLSHQNLGQLPAYLRQLLRVNVGTTVCLGTGSVDATEMEKEFLLEPQDAGKPPDVRALLMRLPTGQALVARRSRFAARIQIPHQPDPPVDTQVVEALRLAALTAYARPRAELERELSERDANSVATDDQTLDAPAQSRPRKTPTKAPTKRPTSGSTIEVRHDKSDDFKPKPK